MNEIPLMLNSELLEKYSTSDMHSEILEYLTVFDTSEIYEDHIKFYTAIEIQHPSQSIDPVSEEEVTKLPDAEIWDDKIIFILDWIPTDAKVLLNMFFSHEYSEEYLATFFGVDTKDFKKLLRQAAKEFNKNIPNEIINSINEQIFRDKVYFLENLPIQDPVAKEIFLFCITTTKSPIKFSLDDKLEAFIAKRNFAYKEFMLIIDSIKNSAVSFEQINEKVSHVFSPIIASKIVDKYFGNFDSIDSSIIQALDTFNERDIAIIRDRLVSDKTLQDIGTEYGVSRERIRQVESTVMRKMSRLIPIYILRSIADKVQKYKIVSVDQLDIKDEALRTFFVQLISHKDFRNSFIYDKEQDALILDRDYSFFNIKTNVFHFMDTIDSTECHKYEMAGYVNYLYPKIDAYKFIEKVISSGEAIELKDGSLIFIQSLYRTKRKKIEFIYSKYPEGFETSKKIDELRATLELYFSETFTDDTNRSITALSSFSDNILLWDWGKHIHIKFVQDILENFDFGPLLSYLDQQLQQVTAIDLEAYFNKHEHDLALFGIPSKYALHTLLKHKFPDDYSYQDSPWIASLGTERLELKEILFEIMAESRIYTLDELMTKMKTSKNRVIQLIERLNDVIMVDSFQYVKREYIELEDTLLMEMVQFINYKVRELQFIYIGIVVDHFRDSLDTIWQYNKDTVLLQLLQKYTGSKGFNVSNSRFVSIDYQITRNSLNFHYIIEQFMGERSKISKNEIFDYFTTRGLESRVVMQYFHYSRYRSLTRIDDNNIVKLASIEIDDQIRNSVIHFVEKNINGEHRLQDLVDLLNQDDLLKKYRWNRLILCDILDKDLFRFIPSTENPTYVEYKIEAINNNESSN